MSGGQTRRAVAAGVGALMWACANPAGPGEQLYREGDLRGAVASWRAADAEAMAARIAEVEHEIDARADGYIASASALESQGRLAESLLDYRLALALRPDDVDTLAHVQRLARTSLQRRTALFESYREVRTRGDLNAARDALVSLRELDPFEPAFETEERRLARDLEEQERRRRERIRQAQATRVEALVESGRAAFSEERLEDALESWRRAQMIDPENERIQAYISRAEKQLDSLERLRAEPEDAIPPR